MTAFTDQYSQPNIFFLIYVERRLLDFRFIYLTCIYVSRNISLNTEGCSLKKMIIMLSLFYLKDLLSWYKEWSIVPIIQTPERIQLKYRLNIKIKQSSINIWSNIFKCKGKDVTLFNSRKVFDFAISNYYLKKNS
jgi:hypothetical protein